MADKHQQNGGQVSYYTNVNLTDAQTGETVTVSLSQPDADRCSRDPSFANNVFMTYQALNQRVPLTAVQTASSKKSGELARPSQSASPTPGCSTHLSPVRTPISSKSREPDGLLQSDAPSGPGSKTHTPSDDRKTVWSSEATLFLIKRYGAYREERERPTITAQEVWQMIARDLAEEGFLYCWEKCSVKWRSLKQRFMALSDASKKSGSGKMPSWRFFGPMKDATSGDPAVEPTNLLKSASSPIAPKNAGPSKSPAKGKRKNEFIKHLQELREERQARHAERVRMHEEKMEISKKKLELFSALITSIQKYYCDVDHGMLFEVHK